MKNLYGAHQAQKQLLFYTCATKFYENFVTPYIFFAAKHNPGACFEFIVDDVLAFQERHGDSLNWLRTNFDLVIHLRGMDVLSSKPHMDNSIRFIIEPELVAEYIYIGDIDIMIFEDIAAWHRPVFDSGLPYSNIVRDKSKRLSGLHFTKYDAYYPLPDIADLVQSVYNDEELLYSIVERKGFLYNNDKYYAVKKRRPIHGLHLSLNRLPFSYHKERVSWGMSYQHLEAAHKIFESSEFNSFLGTLYTGSAQVIMNLIYISQGVCSFGEDYFTRMITAPQKMSARSEKLTSRSYIKERFSAIYQKNDWGSPESKSGPSSTIKRTSQIRKELPELFKRHSVKSVLDAPCGDLNWMSTLIRQGHIERYIGCDIVDSLIDENKQKFADLSNVSFISVDIIKDDLPASDMLLCRDCLFHFSYFDIQKFMTNFVNSEIPFLLTTSHYNKSGFVNKDIATGGWRWFDLFSAPFLFSSPIECIPDGADRELCLFKKEQIIEFLGEWKQQEIAVVI